MRQGTVEVPQPWESAGLSRDEYLAWALEREQQGETLVVETLVDAYPEDDEETWCVDYFVWSDWRTESIIATRDGEEEPTSDDLDQVVIVERRVSEHY